MRVRVQKWGNSLALRIPKSFAAEARLNRGDEVEMSLADGRLVINPVPAPRWTLEQLLAGITPENRHGELDTGGPLGSEVW